MPTRTAMRHADVTERLQDMKRVGLLADWRFINLRWEVTYYDEWEEEEVRVPLTTPQVEGFLSGVSCGMGWVRKVAREVKEQQEEGAGDEVFALRTDDAIDDPKVRFVAARIGRDVRAEHHDPALPFEVSGRLDSFDGELLRIIPVGAPDAQGWTLPLANLDRLFVKG